MRWGFIANYCLKTYNCTTCCAKVSPVGSPCLGDVCPWALLLVTTLVGHQELDKTAAGFFALLAGCGVVVVGCVAVVASQFGRVGGAIAGMLCGFLPKCSCLAGHP